jgi:hypothetical protein
MIKCQPNLIRWSGGTPPYSLEAANNSTMMNVGIVDKTAATSYTWTAETTDSLFFYTVIVRDSMRAVAHSSEFAVADPPGACDSGGTSR